MGDTGFDALEHLVGAVARAHDDAGGLPLAGAADTGIGDNGEAVGRGCDQHFLVALARARKRLALHPPAPRRREAVERKRVRGRLAGGQRPEAAVSGDPVAVHVAGAGL